MTPEFDEDRLVAATDVLAADPGGVLPALAGTGAAVRAAIARSQDWNLNAIADTRPRAVLVATGSDLDALTEVLAALGADRQPVQRWYGPTLPRWANAGDLLVVASLAGDAPTLAPLVLDAGRRGLVVVVVALEGGELANAARVARASLATVEPGRRYGGAFWSALVPLLLACAAAGAIDPVSLAELNAVADDCDVAAEACRPAADPLTNPGKAAATGFADRVPVLVAADALGSAALLRTAHAFGELAGVPALSGRLPVDLPWLRRVVAPGADAADDFFADRLDGTAGRPQLAVLGVADAVGPAADSLAALSAVPGGPVLDLAVLSSASPLGRFAVAALLGEFTAAYLAIGYREVPGDPDAVAMPAMYRPFVPTVRPADVDYPDDDDNSGTDPDPTFRSNW